MDDEVSRIWDDPTIMVGDGMRDPTTVAEYLAAMRVLNRDVHAVRPMMFPAANREQVNYNFSVSLHVVEALYSDLSGPKWWWGVSEEQVQGADPQRVNARIREILNACGRAGSDKREFCLYSLYHQGALRETNQRLGLPTQAALPAPRQPALLTYPQENPYAATAAAGTSQQPAYAAASGYPGYRQAGQPGPSSNQTPPQGRRGGGSPSPGQSAGR